MKIGDKPNDVLSTARPVLLYDENGVQYTSSNPIPIQIDKVEIGDIDVHAFQTETGTDVNAKVNDDNILVVQTGSGTDSSAMTSQVATETTLGTVNTNLGTIETDIEATNTLLGNVVDTSAKLLRTAEQDPIFYHFQPVTLADVTNGTDDTYYYYVFDLLTKKDGNFEGILDGGSGTVTATIEASWQDDGTAPASCTYHDITEYGVDNLKGANASSYTSDFALKLKQGVKPVYVRVKIVADTTEADDADWLLRYTGGY
jgi:hypothetical protein